LWVKATITLRRLNYINGVRSMVVRETGDQFVVG
jgi:hypothetical protein